MHIQLFQNLKISVIQKTLLLSGLLIWDRYLVICSTIVTASLVSVLRHLVASLNFTYPNLSFLGGASGPVHRLAFLTHEYLRPCSLMPSFFIMSHIIMCYVVALLISGAYYYAGLPMIPSTGHAIWHLMGLKPGSKSLTGCVIHSVPLEKTM